MTDIAAKIAFIGLGNMGAPMARRLIAAGYDVAGFDPHTQPDGIPQAPSARAAVADAEFLLTMLPDGDTLRAVLNDIAPDLAPGTLHIDCSTIAVHMARDIARTRARATLDAPVSGGTGGAANGTLTFMVGGPAPAFKTAIPLFDAMGARAIHCGDAGAGQAAKLCNNLILGATMIATCEAFALADKLGLDAQSMYDVVSVSSGQSWSMTTYCPAPGIGPNAPSDNAYTPGFSAALMLKDLRLAVAAAQNAGAATPLTDRALGLYADLVELHGLGGMDFSIMLPHLMDQTRN